MTVRLREGVRWHDRRPLTADDVAFTFQFVAERAHPRFTAQVTEIESVEAIDPLTVVFDLSRPSLGFDDQPLADVPILPRHLWEQLPAGRLAPTGLPVGSGPYRLVRAQERGGYVFRASRDYFGGRPAVDRIDVPIIRQEAATLRLPPRGARGVGVHQGVRHSRQALLPARAGVGGRARCAGSPSTAGISRPAERLWLSPGEKANVGAVGGDALGRDGCAHQRACGNAKRLEGATWPARSQIANES